MSETATHTRGETSALNLITGEPPGIKEILERRAAEGPDAVDPPPVPDPTSRPDDDAEAAAKEVASLKRQSAEDRARADEADRRAARAEHARIAAVQATEDTGFTTIQVALAAATREKEGLVAEMKAAGEAGDFGKMADISTRLGELGAEIRDLSQGKTQFEQDRQARLNAPPRPTEPTVTAASATERGILSGLRAPSREAFLASRTPETRDFLQQHNEFFTDPAAHQRMVGAESLARGRGLAVDSQAYFDTIREAALGQTTQLPARREPAERSTPPAAAPSREAPSPTGRRGGTGDVYVSADDHTTATWMGVDPVEYVKERERLKNVGAWPHARR